MSKADAAPSSGGASGTGGANTGGGGPPPPFGSGGFDVGGPDAGEDADADDGPGICNDLTIQTVEVVPTVLLLVDNSSSMFTPRADLWDPLYNALMDPTTGVVAGLQDKVRFGFTSYKSVARPTLDPTCPTLLSTEFGRDNYDAINMAYQSAGTTPTTDYKWDTPTGASVRAVRDILVNYDPFPPGPKMILLVTDGNPDTCAVRDPQCGQDESILAVQETFAAGITTSVIGIGEILVNNAGCTGRCGRDHLQDLANAGAGQPVAPNTEENGYSQCVVNPANFAAAYAASAAEAGTAPYYVADGANAAENLTRLRTAISSLINQVRGCTFEMNATVVGDASLGELTVNGQTLTYGDPNGWQLEDTRYSVTLLGTACESWKESGGELYVAFPCERVVTEPRPIPEPE